MTGHHQTEQFVLTYHFYQKQSASMFLIYQIFPSIFESNWFLSLFILFYFLNYPQNLQNKLFLLKEGEWVVFSAFFMLDAEGKNRGHHTDSASQIWLQMWP